MDSPAMMSAASDLWAPLALLAALALLPIAVHFFWAQARWAYLKKRSLHSPAARAQRATNPAHAHTPPNQNDGLTPLDALTAQRRPVVLVEEYWPAQQAPAPTDGNEGREDHEDYESHALDASTAAQLAHSTPFAAKDSNNLNNLNNSNTQSAASNTGRQEPRFIEPGFHAPLQTAGAASPGPRAEPAAKLASEPATGVAPNDAQRVPVLTVAPQAMQTPSPAALLPPHAVMQYVIRLVWQRPPNKDAVNAALADWPWPGAMPVQQWLNASGTALELGLYLVNRQHAAQARDFSAFERWARMLAKALGADEPPEFLAEAALLQTRAAQHLLADLDSVFNVRLHVPASQLNLFEQSLMAARFIAVQEHWSYQENKHSEGLWLERLWGAPEATTTQAAIFQMAIDIPHLGVLEARRAYMRLRAVARASAAIVQTDEGAHLSEGMIEKFAREITSRQELLAKAGIEPGSASARVLFRPRIKMQKDFAAFGAPQG